MGGWASEKHCYNYCIPGRQVVVCLPTGILPPPYLILVAGLFVCFFTKPRPFYSLTFQRLIPPPPTSDHKKDEPSAVVQQTNPKRNCWWLDNDPPPPSPALPPSPRFIITPNISHILILYYCRIMDTRDIINHSLLVASWPSSCWCR